MRRNSRFDARDDAKHWRRNVNGGAVVYVTETRTRAAPADKSDMQKAEYKKYKAALEAKRAELARGLSRRDEIAIQKTADALDEVQFATERELAIRNLDRESGLMRAVRAALARMEDGTYGACIHCEEEIKARRLDALPWAAYCVNCQELLDSRRKNEEGGERIEELVEDTV
ncbi:MAG: TraR/DksA family transcriptional regulator [Bryobacteraceae bacterium]